MTEYNENGKKPNIQDYMPPAEIVQQELAKTKSMDDFFGKGGIFARLFSNTLEQMLQAELSEHLGYEPHESKGRNNGNNRNGHTTGKSALAKGKQPSKCRGIVTEPLSL